jgi:UMF1 family MFS transporter
MEKNNKKTINAWCVYDWANSVYSLTITTAIFPLYFMGVTANESNNNQVNFFGYQVVNSVLFSWSVSFIFLAAAILSPLLTSIADRTGLKKTFMKTSCYIGAIACASMFFFDASNVTFGILAFILAGIGYSSSIVFYNSYLPEIATEDQFDRISAKGFSLGYIGSVLLLILNLVLIMNASYLGITTGRASQISFLSVGIWWFVFAQYTFYHLPKTDRVIVGVNVFKNSFEEIKKVFLQVRDLPLLKRFLYGFFFYNMGVQTVMYLAPIFAEEVIKVESDELIVTILLIQLVAIIGAITMNKLSSIYGNIKALIIGVVIWIAVCMMAYIVTKGLSFYLLAATIGFVMGGIQSLSRSTFSKLLPSDIIDTASFFSYYDVIDKLAIVFGTFSYGLIRYITGDMRNSIFALAFYFAISLLFLFRIPSKVKYQTS